MNLLRPTMTFGWPLTALLAMALVLSPVSGLVRSDEPVTPSIEQQPLFKAGEDGYFNYRIPSLVVTSRGTVLALCEARKKTGHDWDDVDLALRRSTDHGRTWSKMQIIADEGELTINQPCPVVDHQTGTIWLPLCRGSKPGLGNAEVLLMKSTDDGQTWPIASEPLAHLGGYSDLAVTGDRKVLCLYETWPSYKEFGENRANLVLAKFNVEWLSAGKDTLATPRTLPNRPSGHR